MKSYNNPYSQKIYAILTPLIGDLMAQGVIRSQAQKLGFTDENVTQNNILPLSEEIKKGLVLFLGSEKASQIAGKIASIK